MDKVDLEAIAFKVHELSKDSDHFRKQKEKTERARQQGLEKLTQIQKFAQNEKLMS